MKSWQKQHLIILNLNLFPFAWNQRLKWEMRRKRILENLQKWLNWKRIRKEYGFHFSKVNQISTWNYRYTKNSILYSRCTWLDSISFLNNSTKRKNEIPSMNRKHICELWRSPDSYSPIYLWIDQRNRKLSRT